MNNATARPKKPTTQGVIADAAMKCIEKYGVAKVTMADVAAQAHLSRQSVYRFFNTRSELLEYILLERVRQIAEETRPLLDRHKDIANALVDGSLAVIQHVESDPLFLEIAEHSNDHRIEQFLFAGSQEIDLIMQSLWQNLLDQARAKGQLRANITNEEAVEWIRNVHAMLRMHPNYNQTKRRQILQKFVVSSLIVDQPPR